MAASALYSVLRFLPPLSHKPPQPTYSLYLNPHSISLSSSKFSAATVAAPKLARSVFRVHGLVDDDSVILPQPESPNSEAGASIDLNLPRRSLLVQFTCDLCGERTKRLVNRLAYERGAVFVQCAGCLRHHKLVDNLGLITEYDFREKINRDSETD
ncbi:DNL-type zinc finger protein, partial [Mucuna pruriens]